MNSLYTDAVLCVESFAISINVQHSTAMNLKSKIFYLIVAKAVNHLRPEITQLKTFIVSIMDF